MSLPLSWVSVIVASMPTPQWWLFLQCMLVPPRPLGAVAPRAESRELPRVGIVEGSPLARESGGLEGVGPVAVFESNIPQGKALVREELVDYLCERHSRVVDDELGSATTVGAGTNRELGAGRSHAGGLGGLVAEGAQGFLLVVDLRLVEPIERLDGLEPRDVHEPVGRREHGVEAHGVVRAALGLDEPPRSFDLEAAARAEFDQGAERGAVEGLIQGVGLEQLRDVLMGPGHVGA